MTGHQQRALVVGGGRAGVAAVEQLRSSGFTDEIMVIHDEPVMPYDRPACAKGILAGKQLPSDIEMPMSGGLDVHWMLGRRAVDLDPWEKVLTLDDGQDIDYDGLVIATGAGPVTPPDWPVGAPGFHTLYSLDDAWRLRQELRYVESCIVVGGGLTGCEVASYMRHTGRECTLIDPSDRVLGRPLGSMAAGLVTEEIARQGTDLRLGRRVKEVAPYDGGWWLGLDDGSEAVADCVVASVGERPDVSWLQGIEEIDTSNGVLCDERLRVVGVPDVVAAGTVARWPNLQYSSEPIRLGQWITAWEHGRAAAATLLGGEPPGGSVTHIPRFWSDQFGLRIQVIGMLPAEGEVRVTYLRPGRKDTARSGVLVGYYGETGLEGVVAVNAVRAFTSMARGLLATAGPVVAAETVDIQAPRLAAAV